MNNENKKYRFASFGVFVHVAIAFSFILYKQFDATLWGILLGSLTTSLSVYYYANVKQKDIISKNFHPELVDK